MKPLVRSVLSILAAFTFVLGAVMFWNPETHEPAAYAGARMLLAPAAMILGGFLAARMARPAPATD